MAAIASVTSWYPGGNIGMEVVRGTVTTTGDTYTSKLGTIEAVFVHDETTTGGANATFATNVVTVAATGSDVVDILIFGKP